MADPSSKQAILEEDDIVDGPGMDPGTRAAQVNGELVGFAVARHGVEGKEVFTKGEMDMLKEWFATGGPGDIDQVEA